MMCSTHSIRHATHLGVTLFVLCIPVQAFAQNLLVNPGFETVVRGTPQAWQVFVAPMEGAEGGLDERVAVEGERSVKLHNPECYAREPANNWSQNIVADLAGTQLEVSGSIRTDEATEAAIWLQCFRKSPFAVLGVATTSTDSPVYGTKEWTPVKMTVDVPEGTNFVVVRCVLKGSGTAWFDSIEVSPSSEQAAGKNDEGVPQRDGEQNKHEPKKATTKPETAREMPASAMPLEEAGIEDVFEMLAEIPDASKSAAGLDAEVKKQLSDSHQAMVDTNQTLRDMNVILMDQVLSLKDELETLKTELARIRTAAGLSPAEAPQPSESVDVKIPPLVPHGAKWEELVK